jgi:hypothetical protein
LRGGATGAQALIRLWGLLLLRMAVFWVRGITIVPVCRMRKLRLSVVREMRLAGQRFMLRLNPAAPMGAHLHAQI